MSRYRDPASFPDPPLDPPDDEGGLCEKCGEYAVRRDPGSLRVMGSASCRACGHKVEWDFT